MESHPTSPDQANARGEKLFLAVRRLIRPSTAERTGVFLVLLNLAVYFIRPQDLPGLGFLGAIRMPMFISFFPLFAWLGRLSRTWTFQTRIMMFFLLFEGLRTVVGWFVIDDLVRNDFWAYNVWKDLFLQFCTLIFPLVAFFDSGQALRNFLKLWFLLGVYLALYAITHTGVGPGGFIGDENDVGLALLVFLPFPLAYLTDFPSAGAKRLRWFAVAATILMGVISTVSRGAFVGLVCVLFYFFLRSKKKLALVAAGLMMAIVVVPFLPKDYVSEMQSIQDTSGGTAEIRRHYWSLATRVFLDPFHIPFGVGLGNTSFHMGDYETPLDLERFPSSAGRAVHSIYFEILPDLGLWGVFIVGSIVIYSLRKNSKNINLIDRLLRSSRRPPSEATPVDKLEAGALAQLRGELEFLRPFFMAINVAFIALFSAGAFISVLYYPMLWLLSGLSGALDRYFLRLVGLLQEHSPPVSAANK